MRPLSTYWPEYQDDAVYVISVSVAFGFILFLIAHFLSPGAQPMGPTIGRLLSSGTVEQRHARSFNWERVKKQSSLFERDVVFVPKGTVAVVTLNDKRRLELSENSLVSFERVDGFSFSLTLLAGHAKLKQAGSTVTISGEKAQILVSQEELKVSAINPAAQAVRIEVQGTSLSIAQEGQEARIQLPKVSAQSKIKWSEEVDEAMRELTEGEEEKLGPPAPNAAAVATEEEKTAEPATPPPPVQKAEATPSAPIEPLKMEAAKPVAVVVLGISNPAPKPLFAALEVTKPVVAPTAKLEIPPVIEAPMQPEPALSVPVVAAAPMEAPKLEVPAVTEAKSAQVDTAPDASIPPPDKTVPWVDPAEQKPMELAVADIRKPDSINTATVQLPGIKSDSGESFLWEECGLLCFSAEAGMQTSSLSGGLGADSTAVLATTTPGYRVGINAQKNFGHSAQLGASLGYRSLQLSGGDGVTTSQPQGLLDYEGYGLIGFGDRFRWGATFGLKQTYQFQSYSGGVLTLDRSNTNSLGTMVQWEVWRLGDWTFLLEGKGGWMLPKDMGTYQINSGYFAEGRIWVRKPLWKDWVMKGSFLAEMIKQDTNLSVQTLMGFGIQFLLQGTFGDWK